MWQAKTPGSLDPVANFHLSNGAKLAGLSWAVMRSAWHTHDWRFCLEIDFACAVRTSQSLLALSMEQGDLSPIGLQRSYGLMAHYCYSEFDALDDRAAQYQADGIPQAAPGALILPG